MTRQSDGGQKMILFHNADYRDIKSIMDNGLMPLSKTKNDRWISGKRANNSDDVVYLFKPIGRQNSFTQYGICLIKVETSATENDLVENDRNHGKYTEYITDSVSPEEIKAIYIPAIFKPRIQDDLEADIIDKIVWCEMEADEYDEYIPTGFCKGYHTYKKVDEHRMKVFAETAELCVDGFNYFRGIAERNEVFDVYNVVYKL